MAGQGTSAGGSNGARSGAGGARSSSSARSGTGNRQSTPRNRSGNGSKNPGARSATAVAASPTAKPPTARSRGGAASAAAKPAPPQRAAAQVTAPAGAAAPASLLGRAWWPFRTMGAAPFITFLLSLYGIGASIYLTYTHYAGVAPVCSNNGTFNCEAVTTSTQSMVFGVFPVAVLGLAFYLFMAAINSPWGWRLTQPLIGRVRLGSVIVGMCFVLYLVYAEVIQINAICLWCTSVHIATFLIFVILVYRAAFAPAKLPPGAQS
ncbi:MAG TPA: vitamin K epoxide reductase family protein [Streptosporangiaceae bacterium]|jgi:uncharacterized membrane protein